MVPEHTRVLVLNQDRMPLSIVGWKKAVKRLYDQSYNAGNPPPIVVEYYERMFKDSVGREHFVPAVIANGHQVKRNYKKVAFSRRNVYKRDGFHCQYCLGKHKASELTVDHVVPRSMWEGQDTPTCWHNIVACCVYCNSKKRNRTPEQANMPLKKVVNGKVIQYKRPKKPNYAEVILGSSCITMENVPQEWKIYFQSLGIDRV